MKPLTPAEDAERFNMPLRFRAGGRQHEIEPGRYARLAVGADGPPAPAPQVPWGTTVVMSDTQMERRSNWEFISEARGDVLIAGLGLGFMLLCLIPDPQIRTITVIEKERNVVDLVWKHVVRYRDTFGWLQSGIGERYRDTFGWLQSGIGERYRGPELNIIVDDIRTWRPGSGVKFDTIYFDIWANICQDNLPEIAKLHQTFKSRKRLGGWMNSWEAGALRDAREEERRNSWR